MAFTRRADVQAVSNHRASAATLSLGVTTNYVGGMTLLGGDVAGDMLEHRGVPYSMSSPLIGAATIVPDAVQDDFSGLRRVGTPPTIGAFEYREVD